MIGNTYAEVVKTGNGSQRNLNVINMPMDGDCMFHAISGGVGGGGPDRRSNIALYGSGLHVG